MSETQTEHAEPKKRDEPIIHRVCEACNNMFATYPSEKSLRCPKCTKE